MTVVFHLKESTIHVFKVALYYFWKSNIPVFKVALYSFWKGNFVMMIVAVKQIGGHSILTPVLVSNPQLGLLLV